MPKQLSKFFPSFWRRSLSAQLLSAFILLLVIITLFLAMHAISRGSDRAYRAVRAKGELLARHLALNIRMGVFAENQDLLKDNAENILSDPDVVRVGIYNSDMKPLFFKSKGAANINSQPAGGSAAAGENSDIIEIQAPVVISQYLQQEKMLYIDVEPAVLSDRPIGLVKITLSLDATHLERQSIVLRNTAVALILICVCIIIIYLWLRKTMKPLETLTQSVRALGRGEAVVPVLVDTENELGKLSSAFNEMLAERKAAEQSLARVLMDIHDGIGGITTNISLLSAIAQRSSSPDEVKTALARITDLAHDGMVEIRNLMFSLDSNDLSWSAVAGELKSYGIKAVEPHSISFEMTKDIDQTTAAPKRLLCLHLFRIYREALTNVIKHSQSKKLMVSLRVENARLSLKISDDGIGSGKTTFINMGRGVRNMKARSFEIGGTLSITGDEGTCVSMDVPLP